MKTSQSENGDADLMILGLAGISLTGYYPRTLFYWYIVITLTVL